MEPFTLTRDFQKRHVVDDFTSFIWTERYYGDSEVEFVVPVTMNNIKYLANGTLLGIPESKEIMIIETMNIENGLLKLKGISLLPWLNNRVARNSSVHKDRYWYISNEYPGSVLWVVIREMCTTDSALITGSNNNNTGLFETGRVISPSQMVIDQLWYKSLDTSDAYTKFAIPYGPLYDAIREIAVAYQIGMSITLEDPIDVPSKPYFINAPYVLAFRSYKGIDYTSSQSDNPVVRFSAQMDSFTNIKELQSVAALKTVAYSFAPNYPDGGIIVGLPSGFCSIGPSDAKNFDLRAMLVFADDISSDPLGGGMVAASLATILDQRAQLALAENSIIRAVDGEIVPNVQYQYGVDYSLGDLIEVAGNTGTIQKARITEYIRTQDAGGEKAYPTVSMIG